MQQPEKQWWEQFVVVEKRRKQIWVDVANENLVAFGENELKDIGQYNELEDASEMTEDDQAKQTEIEKLIARETEFKQVSFTI